MALVLPLTDDPWRVVHSVGIAGAAPRTVPVHPQTSHGVVTD